MPYFSKEGYFFSYLVYRFFISKYSKIIMAATFTELYLLLYACD